jgi:hypothetical protein
MSFITNDTNYYDVPLNINAGYTFAPSADFSPYIELGLAYHIAGGDYVENSSPGLLGGIGLEFNRNSVVGFGIELMYDSSEVGFENFGGAYYGWDSSDATKDMKPYKSMVSFFVMF